MMSNVSHELWTPLNAIISSSEIGLSTIILLEQSWENPDIFEKQISKLKKWNNTAKTSSRLLLHLVNDILDLGRLENEAFWLNFEYTGVDEIFEDIKELFIT